MGGTWEFGTSVAADAGSGAGPREVAERQLLPDSASCGSPSVGGCSIVLSWNSGSSLQQFHLLKGKTRSASGTPKRCRSLERTLENRNQQQVGERSRWVPSSLRMCREFDCWDRRTMPAGENLRERRRFGRSVGWVCVRPWERWVGSESPLASRRECVSAAPSTSWVRLLRRTS